MSILRSIMRIIIMSVMGFIGTFLAGAGVIEGDIVMSVLGSVFGLTFALLFFAATEKDDA